jgi:hypothetical protein
VRFDDPENSRGPALAPTQFMTCWRFAAISVLFGVPLVGIACSDNSGDDSTNGAVGTPTCTVDGGLPADAGATTCPPGCYLFGTTYYVPGIGPTMVPLTCVPGDP